MLSQLAAARGWKSHLNGQTPTFFFPFQLFSQLRLLERLGCLATSPMPSLPFRQHVSVTSVDSEARKDLSVPNCTRMAQKKG